MSRLSLREIQDEQKLISIDVIKVMRPNGNKARKQKIALTMAHQELKQLTPELLNTMRTTGTKIVGKVTAPDARTMAEEMNCTKEQLQGVRKVDFKYAEYTAYVNDLTESGIKMKVPFGTLENEMKMSGHSFYKLMEQKMLELVGKSVIDNQPDNNTSAEATPNDPEQDFGSPELL